MSSSKLQFCSDNSSEKYIRFSNYCSRNLFVLLMILIEYERIESLIEMKIL